MADYSLVMATTPLLQASVLVVEQKRKFFEMRNQYRIFDESGTQIGAVEQSKQSVMAFVTRFGSDLDALLPVSLEVTDSAGQPVLVMGKPWFRMTFSVSRPDGTRLGSIAKRIKLGKARFTITDPSGAEMGEIRAQNWRAKDFSVTDHAGNEVARATKQWRGLATEMFTDADTYVVNLLPRASEPLRSIALAGSLAIDVLMKQKDY